VGTRPALSEQRKIIPGGFVGTGIASLADDRTAISGTSG
jgi:hypothetical protein